MIDRLKRHSKRVLVAVGGGLLLIIGIIAIPYPGPGWLIVFAALAILSTEFVWAKSVRRYAKGRYDNWEKWLARQQILVKASVWLGTCTIVVLTLWLFNTYGLLNDWLHLPFDWLRSPLVA